ncbi:MAG: thiopeptide-type bacteriocin biosynthesis protein [Bacteroidota bacterium]
MKLNALNLSLCRVPAFSIYDDLIVVWPALKEKIRMASPSFYAQISNTDAHQISSLPEKIQFTIWKYFNRAKYRATPFASFASYSLVPLSNENIDVKIEARMINHQFTNWSKKEHLYPNEETIFKDCEILYTNTSAYCTDTEIRYLRLSNGEFELASVTIFPELKSLIQFCSSKRSKIGLFEFMKSEWKLNKKQCKNLILQLLQLQLLHTNKTANITGEDYFSRLKLPLADEREPYILAERKWLNGSLNHSKTEEIAEALNFLAQQLPKSQNSDLQNFKTAFLKKFEHQEVPLALVMDPELGTGYGGLAQFEHADQLIEQLIKSASKKTLSQTISYTALHQFLMNRLIENQPIALEEFESVPQKEQMLPNTLSVLCHFYKHQPVIAHAGGCTANSLFGRFTLGNLALETHCKEIAALEQNANPNVLFFDISYQAETHIDNVNRRKSCYKYELPILTWSCKASPLDFNDIMVAVRGDEIVLRSKKLGKRLIPRLASAYNYTRSDLAVYRFLCDLQHQSIQSNLTFDIQTYLPGLNHYPQVRYKKVILSPAKWLIPKSLYQQKNKNLEDCLTELSTWLNQKNITFFIKTGISDQTLCFNPNLTNDLNALFNYCKQQDDRPIYLSEALIDEEATVTDQNGKKYNAEFVINYSHKQQIYSEITSTRALSITHKIPIAAQYLPASAWLYFEIFIHPSKSNNLLHQQIFQLLKVHKTDIKKWFFIRYNEQGKHIRFRLQVKELTKRSCIIDLFNALLTTPIAQGIVSEVALKTYHREIARYGALRITNVEQFFHLDSKYVLSALAKMPDKNKCYQQTIYFINQISSICFPLFKDRLHFVKQITEAFSDEFSIDKNGFKKINQTYNQLKNDKEQVFGFKMLENQANIIFMQCSETEKSKMLADLIHMHINRMFNDHQRLQEAICYQFIYKQLLKEQACLIAQVAHPASA